MTELLHPSFRRFAARRSFLIGSSGVVLSASAIALLAGHEAHATGASAKDASILNTMLGSEYQAIAAYQVGADSVLLQKPVLDLAVQFQGQHKAHADLLAATVKQFGGNPVSPQRSYDFPVAQLKSQDDVLRFAAGLEHGAVTAYLAAVPAFEN